MKRMTSRGQDGKAFVPEDALERCGEGCAGAAAERLALFEDFYEKLQKDQVEMAQKLEALRAEGKKNTVKFRELFGQKLMVSNTLVLLQTYGLV